MEYPTTIELLIGAPEKDLYVYKNQIARLQPNLRLKGQRGVAESYLQVKRIVKDKSLLDKSIDSFLIELVTQDNYIREIASKCTVTFSINLKMSEYNEELFLKPNQLNILSDLNVNFWVDIYADNT